MRPTPEFLTELGAYATFQGDDPMPASPSMVAAPVQSPTASTINWASVLGPVASMLAWAGLNVDPAVLVQIVIGIQAAVSLYVIVRNTWFSPTVLTPSTVGLQVLK